MPCNLAREWYLCRSIQSLRRQFVDMMARAGVNCGDTFHRLLWSAFRVLPDFRLDPHLVVDPEVVAQWRRSGVSEPDCHAMVLDIQHAWRTLATTADAVLDHPHWTVMHFPQGAYLCFHTNHTPILRARAAWVRQLLQHRDCTLAAQDVWRAIYCMLMRYTWLTRQSRYATPPPSGWFDAFASPLHVVPGTLFCSPSPDTDIFFGSCGHWLDMDPHYWPDRVYVHPPAVPSLLDRVVEHLARGLSQRRAHTLVRVVVPTHLVSRGMDRLHAWADGREIPPCPIHRYPGADPHWLLFDLTTREITTQCLSS